MLKMIAPAETAEKWRFPVSEMDSITPSDITSAAIARVNKSHKETKSESISNIFSSTVDPVDIISNYYYNARFSGATPMENVEHMQFFDGSLDSPHTADTATSPGGQGPRSHTVRTRMLDQFQQDLHAFSYAIPKGLNLSKLTRAISEKSQGDFEHLSLRLKLLKLLDQARRGLYYLESTPSEGALATTSPNPISSTIMEEDEDSARSAAKSKEKLVSLPTGMVLGKKPRATTAIALYQALLNEQTPILKSLEEDYYSFSPSFLRKIIEVCMAQDYLRGLDLGRKIIEVYEKHERTNEAKFKFSNVCTIAHLLLYPTVYDETTPTTTSSAAPSRLTDQISTDSANSLSSSRSQDDISPNQSIKRCNALETLLRSSKLVVPMLKLE